MSHLQRRSQQATAAPPPQEKKETDLRRESLWERVTPFRAGKTSDGIFFMRC